MTEKELSNNFINFIEKYQGGIYLQLIVDYETGNETGTPTSPVKYLISEFEENILHDECTNEMIDIINRAYNHWWFYASDVLLSED